MAAFDAMSEVLEGSIGSSASTIDLLPSAEALFCINLPLE
jgi:hypothetical protein